MYFHMRKRGGPKVDVSGVGFVTAQSFFDFVRHVGEVTIVSEDSKPGAPLTLLVD